MATVDLGINFIILRVRNNVLGEVWNLPIMGKTVEGWAASAVGAPYTAFEASPVIDLADKIKPVLDANKPFTVVLYADTPLVTQKTVSAAIEQLKARDAGVVKLPRGCVYKTKYLAEQRSVYPAEPSGTGEFEAVADSVALSRITDLIRRRILHYHASRGVVISDFQNTYIDCDVVMEKGVVVEPYNFIKGKTIIKENAHILPGNYIENCIIGSDTRIDSSRMYNSLIGAETRVGPFAYIRPDTVIGYGCRIGDFVELKNCVIGDGCKVSHLTYIGDAELGKECNVGCGVVFANYDGKNKYKSVVGNRVFIGSNANIVAPVTIEDRAFIAAGSTITKGVPEHALAIARARQSVIPDWAGNMYAPKSEATMANNRSQYNLVRYDDGIIDATSTENANAPKVENGGNDPVDNNSGANGDQS